MANLLDELCIKHPYYLDTENLFSDQPSLVYDNWLSFCPEWRHADVDMNLVFRWDMFMPCEDYPFYRLRLGIIQQRKGIYQGVTVNNLTEQDKVDIVSYLNMHYIRNTQNWLPFHQL